jgi:hypothetical protein
LALKRSAARAVVLAVLLGVCTLAFVATAGGRDARSASTITFSFQAYANNVRVVAPLVGKWQLGKARIHGSGVLGSGAQGTVNGNNTPIYYPPSAMSADVIAYHYVGAAHDAYRKLTLTIEITSASGTNAECVPGTRGTMTLYDSKQKLSNGQPSDYVVMGHWTASHCPGFVQGWTNEDGGARTSPHYGGPPHGGQWAVVRISAS